MEKRLLGQLYFFSPFFGLALGIFFASLSFASLSLGVFLLFLGFVVGIFLLLFRGNRAKEYGLIALVCICCGIGIVRFESTQVYVPESFPQSREVGIYGVINREPRLREMYREYVLETESGANVLVRGESFPEMVFGDQILARGTLSLPEPFVTDNGRVFDYAAYLEKEGISHILSFAQIEKVGEETMSIRGALFRLKGAFLEQIEEAVPYPASSLIAGVLLGTEDALGNDLLDIFRTVGIIHIVVLSGYNITIVAESVLRAIAFLGRRRALFIAAISVTLFSIMVGGSPSVMRAALMGLLVLLARATGRRYDVSRALVLAGGIMIFWNPRLLVFDLGFELSFLATVAIIWIAPYLEKKLTLIPAHFGFRDIAATTGATQLFVLPLLIYASGSISLSGFVVNLLVLPVIPALMLVGFITGILGFISLWISLIPGVVAYGLGTYIIRIAEWFALIPGSSITLPTVSGWAICTVYIFFTAFVFFMHRKTSQKTIERP
jgi:competence protein ComEC